MVSRRPSATHHHDLSNRKGELSHNFTSSLIFALRWLSTRSAGGPAPIAAAATWGGFAGALVFGAVKRFLKISHPALSSLGFVTLSWRYALSRLLSLLSAY